MFKRGAMRLNEYPKEELIRLKRLIISGDFNCASDEILRLVWYDRVKEAISDREFEDKELPFKTPENEHN